MKEWDAEARTTLLGEAIQARAQRAEDPYGQVRWVRANIEKRQRRIFLVAVAVVLVLGALCGAAYLLLVS